MRHVVTILLAVGFPTCASAQGQAWELMHVDPIDGRFQAVVVHPTQPERIFAATQHTLYESRDNGKAWQARFRLPETAHATALAVHAAATPTVLLATDHGLYASFDGGRQWELVFRGRGERTTHCTHVAFHPHREGVVLLGTRDGLFMSPDHGRHWTEVATPHEGRAIVHFMFDPHHPDRLYLVSEQMVFAGSITRGQWQQRFHVLDTHEPPANEGSDVDSSEASEAEPSEGAQLSAIAIDPQQPATLYVAGSRGLHKSLDDGLTWQPVTRSGLPTRTIVRVIAQAHSPLVLYAATPRGVAYLKSRHERWTLLALGSATSHVNDLAATSHHLWAATDHGLYRFEVPIAALDGSESTDPREVLSNFVNEPTIAQVRDAAIRYADVHPDKITRWHRQAALRALLPTVDLGMDHNRVRDNSVDEGTFPKFQIIETQDRNARTDLSIKWDLANVIWNNDQTSIDARSRLMVQLRNDVVDEITRTYFERRRIQVALLTNPPNDQQALLEQELRVQELTALLDGLTGGYFSRQQRVVTDTP